MNHGMTEPGALLFHFVIRAFQIYSSDFIWDLRKLLFPSHLGKYFIKSVKIHEIGKIKAIFGLGMAPI